MLLRHRQQKMSKLLNRWNHCNSMKIRNEKSFHDFESKGKMLLSNYDPDGQFIYNCFQKRTKKRNTRYDDGNCPDTVLDDQSKFRIACYYPTLDSILSELREQIIAYEENIRPFAFLNNLDSLPDETIRVQATKLKEIYQSDIDTGISEECLQFEFLMKDVRAASETQKTKNTDQQRTESKHDDHDIDSDDEDFESEKKERKQSTSSSMLKFIKKTTKLNRRSQTWMWLFEFWNTFPCAIHLVRDHFQR